MRLKPVPMGAGFFKPAKLPHHLAGFSYNGLMKIDAHIHIALDGADWRQAKVRHGEGPDEARIHATLQAYAATGYTHLRDGGDKWGVASRAAQLAPAYGIAFASPAFPLYPRGQYGAFLGKPFEGLEEYKFLVDQAQQQGATFVKLMLSGIANFDAYGEISSPGLPAEVVAQLVEYAHGQGLPVMAHVNTASLVRDALNAGVDSVEHGLLMDAATCKCLAASHTVWVPTLAPVHAAAGADARIFREHAANVAAVAVAGGLIAVGSDAGSGGVPHVTGSQTEEQLLGLSSQVLETGAQALVSRFFL